MDIAGDFERLTEEWASSYDERIAAVDRIKKETHNLLKQLENARKERSIELRKTLEGFENAGKEMVTELRKTLEGFASEREAMAKAQKETLPKEVADMLDGFKRARSDLTKEVAELLEGFGRGRRKASEVWNKLVSEMAKKRGAPVKRVAKPKVAKPKVEAVEEGVEEKILMAVKDTPGMTLKEIADTIGMHFVRIAGVAKELVEAGKIRKEDKEYYPVE